MLSRLIVVPVLALGVSMSPASFAKGGQFAQCMQSAFKNLNLTADQKAKIKTLKEQSKANLGDKWKEMDSMHQQIKEIVQSDKIDESKLDAIVNQKKELIGATIKNRVILRHDMYQVFTPKQKEAFSKKVDHCEAQMVEDMRAADDAG